MHGAYTFIHAHTRTNTHSISLFLISVFAHVLTLLVPFSLLLFLFDSLLSKHALSYSPVLSPPYSFPFYSTHAHMHMRTRSLPVILSFPCISFILFFTLFLATLYFVVDVASRLHLLLSYIYVFVFIYIYMYICTYE